MRLALATLLVGLVTGLAAGLAGNSLSRAQANESFYLEQHDTILVETPGCYSTCTAMGTRRLCTVRELECKAVCRTLPECRPDGFPMKVCAVVKSGR
jgi:hypothetical protein